ncbi:MAG: ABC transporter substrate-binding protein [Ilumatobacteraceae bacterium]|jgi:peptide/nickel transport system substrate-binding protein|nr:ABC transporter substrate-binding protein [Acidimicrobiaceae bacterium]MBP6487257.1 ABC transporter substrate-binding protein [Ilumatobacteraceae bacterium]MBP7887462.1 ABC transporter substrate-binding protein [Ilumatobacteraceae bacterium]MBP8211338.1 ABC transporter substrate-binding protein [Ilumatobacteraceae bacterium]MBP9053108.1 ABC transporter substrate-binding protein [Ilumatobacteraceae bacterium]
MSKSMYEGAGRDLGSLETGLIDSYVGGGLSRRSFLVRGSVMGLGAAFLGSILAACGDDEDASPSTGGSTGAIKEGGTLRVASQRPGGPIDPVAMDNLGSYTIATTAFEYLCGKGEGAAIAPMLAESWSPNDDGSEWTFKLRSGVKWHDGTPFTAADVVATLDRLSVGNLASYIEAGAGTAVDDLTVTVKLLLADGQFPYQLSIWNPQSLITPADYETGTTLDGRPSGTGPFKLEKYDIATGATFARNDDWWGGKPNLEKVDFVFSDDIATQITGVLGGQADAIVLFAVVGGDALLSNPDVTVESISGAAHRQLWMNTREGTFTDVRVRQAVALGINRQELLDVVLKGRGQMGNDHPVAPSYEFFDSTQPQRERDIEKAKALLEEAGKAGLAVTMHVPKLVEIPQLAELMQTQLKDIGMDVTLNVISTDTFYDSWCKVYDSEVAPAGCDGGEEFGIVDYGNRGTPDVYLVKAYATGEWNSAHYISEPFNAAVAEYQASLDLAGRQAAIKTVQAIATEDVPYIIPYFYDSLIAYKKNVTGIVATGLGHYYLGSAGFTA